jgi:hypothetical protein
MREEPPGGRTAGIRTFAISAVLGGVIGAIAQSVGGVGSGIAMGLGACRFQRRAGGVLSGGKTEHRRTIRLQLGSQRR